MANYAIIRINKRKLSAVSRLNKHHERKKESYDSNPDIDVSRTINNYHLIEPQDTYRKVILKRIDEVKARRRKDSVVMQDGLITASPDWIKSMNCDEQKAFFEYSLKFVCDRYGKDNMISAVVHMDETTPHMHFSFVPITEDGKLSSKIVIGGPKGMVKLQDEFFEYIVKKYPDISRGLPAKVTHRSHIPPYLYKNATNLYEHYNEICNAIKDIGIVGNSKKKDAAILLLGKYAPEMAKMSEQLKTTEKKVEELERIISNKNNDVEFYKSKNINKDRDINQLKNYINYLYDIQMQLQQQIDMIPPQLLKELEEKEKRERQKEKMQRERGYER